MSGCHSHYGVRLATWNMSSTYVSPVAPGIKYDQERLRGKKKSPSLQKDGNFYFCSSYVNFSSTFVCSRVSICFLVCEKSDAISAQILTIGARTSSFFRSAMSVKRGKRSIRRIGFWSPKYQIPSHERRKRDTIWAFFHVALLPLSRNFCFTLAKVFFFSPQNATRIKSNKRKKNVLIFASSSRYVGMKSYILSERKLPWRKRCTPVITMRAI